MSDKKHKHFTLMNMVLIFAGTLLLVNGLSQIAFADELFVRADRTGTAYTQDQPCSLQTALDLSNESDTIYVATGTYTGKEYNVITLTNIIMLYDGWDGSPTNPVEGDPVFVNPVGLNCHISAKSEAIDTGVNIRVTADIDNDTRTLIDGYDIGTDEYDSWSTFGNELVVDFIGNGMLH